MKTFLIVESFASDRNFKDSVAKFKKTGYLFTQGMKLLNSWQGKDVSKGAFADCITLDEAPNVRLVSEWTKNWAEFSSFMVIQLK